MKRFFLGKLMAVEETFIIILLEWNGNIFFVKKNLGEGMVPRYKRSGSLSTYENNYIYLILKGLVGS